jgi:cyanophycin synthetase
MIAISERATTRAAERPTSFEAWRARATTRGAVPIVAVAGSRGKTTVVRLLETICAEAKLRTASWTDEGVEITGKRQRGELLPWSRATRLLAAGGLDLAIQELDWATINAVGLPAGVYPLIAITNFCNNSETCLASGEMLRAARALASVAAAVHPEGVIVSNGDDYAAATAPLPGSAASVLVAVNKETPLVRRHLRAGGMAAWIDDDELVIGTETSQTVLCSQTHVSVGLNGAVSFELHNALEAAALALQMGIPACTIARALSQSSPAPDLMPGSFNVLPIAGATAIVDRGAPSWFLRPVMRAIGHLPHRRFLAVVGRLHAVSDQDLFEIGRLLGRAGGALILHDADLPARAQTLRLGIAQNQVPPVVIHTGSERQAVNRALRMIRPDDLLLILADEPTGVLRNLRRAAPDGPPDPSASARSAA